MTSVLSSPGLPNPSALALASFSNSAMEFYATNDGETSAALLGFQFEESSSVSAAAANGAGAQLVSLNESSLALLGTLLTVSLETTTTESEAVEVGTAAVASGPSAGGNSLLGRMSRPDEFEEMGASVAVIGGGMPSQLPWARYVTGVDQAIETLRNEADARLLQEQQPAKAQDGNSSFLQENDAAGQTGPAAFVKEAALDASRRIRAERDFAVAIDLAIASWRHLPPTVLRASLFVTTGPNIAKAPAPENVLAPLADRVTIVARLGNDERPRNQRPHSRLAMLGAIYLTAASTREILVGRSHRDGAPARAAQWKRPTRDRGIPVKGPRGRS